ncbi:MAG: hypothetical protein EBS35_05650 [Bacteroidetes bacterium]|nr:hypothetical protein [Bacteroidota bacterium]
MFTKTKMKVQYVMLSLFCLFLVPSCQNDNTKKSETSSEKEVLSEKKELKNVHFDCSMVMGNDKMLYLKHNNSANGIGPVLSCNQIEAKDFSSQNIPATALAACTVEAEQENIVYYTVKEGDALIIFKGMANSKTFSQHLIIPLI